MPFPLSLQKSTRGFTLIELLVVISIIGVLASIVFPVFSSVQNKARRTKVLSDERNLVLGIYNFRGDYGKLPINPDQLATTQTNGDDALYGDPGPNATYPGYELINVLRGVADDKYNVNNLLNPSQTKYFDAQYVKDPSKPASGILLHDNNTGGHIMKAGSFVDPWGAEYVVMLDANRDGDLEKVTRLFYPQNPINQGPKGSVQIGSPGTDGKWGKLGVIDGSDDIVLTQ